MATGNSVLTDLMLLADVVTATGLAERNATAVTAARCPDTPTVSPVVSMLQNTEMSRESTALVAAFAHALQSMQRETPPPKTLLRIPVPEYSGHSDRAMSATDFLLAIQRYRKATGLTEKETLGRVLPVALVGPAARWHRLVGESAGTLDEFTALFRQEFLPADYLPRMRRELEERTQAPAEPFAEYLRAMQELLQIADPNVTNQEQVERVVRQAHPTFSRYLRGRPFGSLSELAQEARRVLADILAERRYHLPPAPTDTLEPRCAWHGPVPRGYRGGGRPQWRRPAGSRAGIPGCSRTTPWSQDRAEEGARPSTRRNSGRPAHHGSPQPRSRLPPTRCHKGVSASDAPLGRILSQVGEAAAFGATKSGTIGATAQGRFRKTEEAA
ncbi:unnamed protein product, partial [Ixodes persulcatus]